LRGRNIPARQPFDPNIQAEMIPQVTLLRREPITSTHKNLSLSLV
jgi:hypothetical protein